MQHTKKHFPSRLYSIVSGFAIGACAGLVLGGITLSGTPLQGILIQNISLVRQQSLTSSSSSSRTTTTTKKPTVRVSAVTQRLLRRAARLRSQKKLVVTTAVDEPKPIVKPMSSAISSIADTQTFHNAAEPRSSVAAVPGDFPAFGHTSFPVAQAPNWGAMHSPDVWNRAYKQMTAADYVAIPKYDMAVLTTPMSSLTKNLTSENEAKITAKLFYSTRFLGSYDVDEGEYSGDHAGVDLKLPLGTPIGAIAGGRVNAVTTTNALGLHVIIEHRLPDGSTVFSVYAHFGSAAVKVGDDVIPGQYIGNVGMTGNTSGPHLHLQIDRGIAGEAHVAYLPPKGTPRSVEEGYLINPMTFIATYRNN